MSTIISSKVGVLPGHACSEPGISPLPSGLAPLGAGACTGMEHSVPNSQELGFVLGSSTQLPVLRTGGLWWCSSVLGRRVDAGEAGVEVLPCWEGLLELV